MQQLLRLSLAAIALAGCASFPQLDRAVSEQAKAAPYPTLVPSESLLKKQELGRLIETDGPALLARADRLRARARILRAVTDVNEDTRLRIGGRLRRLGG